MAGFLLAWEFGQDLGHVRRVVPIAAALREGGHEVHLAFRDATMLGHALDAGFPAWPAPLLKRPSRIDPLPVNASDVLLNLGFRDEGSVAGALDAWRALLDATRADVLVADYAPMALVAAAQRRMPRATIGSGFALPPRTQPLPALRDVGPQGGEVRAQRDTELLERMRRVAAGIEGLTLAALFHGDVDLLCTLPQLDPYGPREGDYLGPVQGTAGGLREEWRTQKPHVLAYLKPRDARFRPLLRALEALDAETIVAAPGLAPGEAAALSSPAVRVHHEPVQLAGLIEHATLCVAHGGAGFAAAALLAGVPLALAPMHLEQELVSRRIRDEALGVLLPAGGADAARAALAAALADAGLAARERDFARANASVRPGLTAGRAAERLARLAA
jgi:UDP:flavonoid glycosyltransferase YjiC (YdhE family)